jgi:AcrR family transcriptional regulator
VAKQAGVSSGTVHYYFETKKDVLTAAFEFNLTDSLA